MTTIDRIRVPWLTAPGGPGVSTFFALDASTALAPLHDFFDAVKAFIVDPITWSFLGEGDTIVAETGALSGGWTATGETGVVATGSNANMANAVGAVVNWNTGEVLFGHRVKGRTFLVPLCSAALAGGTLNDTVIPDIVAAGQAMIDAVPGNFLVWSRPFVGTPSWTDVHGRVHPARTSHAGASAAIVSASVPDMGAVLRSRRD